MDSTKTPYMKFFDEKFPIIAKENPGMSYNEIGKLIGEMWKAITTSGES